MVYVILVLSLLLGISAYVSLNLFQKNLYLQKMVEESDKQYYSAVNVVTFCHRIVSEAFAEMIQIDKRGGFRSDDEVGFVFRALFETVQQAKAVLDNLTKVDGEAEEKGKSKE